MLKIRLFYCKAAFQSYVIACRSNHHFELSRLHRLLQKSIVERQFFKSEFKFYFDCFACPYRDTLEGFEQLGRSFDRTLHIVNVKLHDLFSVSCSAVSDLERDLLIHVFLVAFRDFEVRIFKCCITQTITESIKRRLQKSCVAV